MSASGEAKCLQNAGNWSPMVSSEMGVNLANVDLVAVQTGIYFVHIINSVGEKVVRVVKN